MYLKRKIKGIKIPKPKLEKLYTGNSDIPRIISTKHRLISKSVEESVA